MLQESEDPQVVLLIMILPIRYKTKEEIAELRKTIREMSREDMIKMFVEKGWSLESAKMLTDAMKEGIEN